MANFIYFGLILIPMTLGILVEYNSTYIGVRVYSKIVTKKKKSQNSRVIQLERRKFPSMTMR